MNTLLLVGLLASASVLLSLLLLTKRRFLQRRTPVELSTIFQSDLKGTSMDYETFRRVYEAVGQSYSLDPRLIRPSDSFKDFAAFDSFVLWKGKETMEKWLDDNFVFPKSEQRAAARQVNTVNDLLRLVQQLDPKR